MTLLQLGPIRLAHLNTAGTKLKTFYLPAPSKGGLDLDWTKKATTVEMVDRSSRTRLDGFIPKLTVKWSAYDDRAGQGYTIGTSDGNRPTLESLLWYLSLTTGLIRVSPGLSAGGFTCDAVDVKALNKEGTVYTGIEVTFLGRDLVATRTLDAF